MTVLAYADPSPFLTLDEFRDYAGKLAHKVNLFHDTWQKDPSAEFFGGTSRDFLYWVKRQILKGAKDRADVERNMRQLMALPSIDVRDFIVGESDIDIVSRGRFAGLDADKYGVKRIDTVDPRRLDPEHELGKSEIDQGFIPVEKIRLSSRGILPADNFGDGVRELWEGKLSVHYSPREVFEKTHYARADHNHPVLLALRYLRLAAMHYYYEHGRGYPPKGVLLAMLDPASLEKTREVIAESIKDPLLIKRVTSRRFAEKLNDTVHKAFRTYTSPTAAYELYRELGALKLVDTFSQIQPVNQYLFAKHRDPEEIKRHLEEFSVDPAKFFVPPSSVLPDGKLYHGTKSEQNFRNILFTGILPSQSRGMSAGAGLYGAPSDNTRLAITYAEHNPDLVVTFEVKPDAKLVDLYSREGDRVWKAFRNKYGEDYDKFAEYFGIDLIRYPYDSKAFVVKNSLALSPPVGWKRHLMSFGRFCEHALEVDTKEKFDELLKNLELNNLSDEETELVLERSPYFEKWVEKLKHSFHEERFVREMKDFVAQTEVLKTRPEWYFRAFTGELRDEADVNRFLRAAHIALDLDFTTTPHQKGALSRLALETLSPSDGKDHTDLSLHLIDSAKAFGDHGFFVTVGQELLKKPASHRAKVLLPRIASGLADMGGLLASGSVESLITPALLENPDALSAFIQAASSLKARTALEKLLTDLLVTDKGRTLKRQLAEWIDSPGAKETKVLHLLAQKYPLTTPPGAMSFLEAIRLVAPYLDGDTLADTAHAIAGRLGKEKSADLEVAREVVLARLDEVGKLASTSRGRLRYALATLALRPSAETADVAAKALVEELDAKSADANIIYDAVVRLTDSPVEISAVKAPFLRLLASGNKSSKELIAFFARDREWKDPEILSALVANARDDRSSVAAKIALLSLDAAPRDMVAGLIHNDEPELVRAALAGTIRRQKLTGKEYVSFLVRHVRRLGEADLHLPEKENDHRHYLLREALEALFDIDPKRAQSETARLLNGRRRAALYRLRLFEASSLYRILTETKHPELHAALTAEPGFCTSFFGLLAANRKKAIALSTAAALGVFDYKNDYPVSRSVGGMFSWAWRHTFGSSDDSQPEDKQTICTEMGGEWNGGEARCVCPDGERYLVNTGKYASMNEHCATRAVARFNESLDRFGSSDASLNVKEAMYRYVTDHGLRAKYEIWKEHLRGQTSFWRTQADNLRGRKDTSVYTEIADLKQKMQADGRDFEKEMEQLDHDIVEKMKAACPKKGARFYKRAGCVCPDGDEIKLDEEGTCRSAKRQTEKLRSYYDELTSLRKTLTKGPLYLDVVRHSDHDNLVFVLKHFPEAIERITGRIEALQEQAEEVDELDDTEVKAARALLKDAEKVYELLFPLRELTRTEEAVESLLVQQRLEIKKNLSRTLTNTRKYIETGKLPPEDSHVASEENSVIQTGDHDDGLPP